MRRHFFAAAVLLCFVLPTSVLAQTSNATVGGTVSDATGALIPGVEITATNTQTGIVTNVLSNESGAYQFASLQPGSYTVGAQLTGFQTQTYSNVTLGVSQQVRLNFTLQVGTVATGVEVTIAADTLIATSSSSVGTVLSEARVRELPLGSRNVLDLLGTTAGAGPTDGAVDGNFSGGRISAVNITRDGLVVTNGRYNQGVFATTYLSPDLVEEVRVITAPVDAEAGRGAGQVQMSTRSGTNQFRGALFWTNQNSALDAKNWFDNFNGAEKAWENRNQFGGRLGGPIVRNKTFFFVLVEEQRDVTKTSVVGPVLTAQARQGIFRFFPGVNNGNTTANTPTVNAQGVPVQPATALGPLEQFNLFTLPSGSPRDPLRPSFDPTGFVQGTMMKGMPLPNDYTIGDGLNTAGFRWTRRVSGFDLSDGNSYDQNNRDQLNLRLDHNFNSSHKLSFVYTYERGLNHTSQAGLRDWPTGYDGQSNKWPRLYNTSLVSTLSSTLVNELRVGLRRAAISSWAAFYVGRKSGDPTKVEEPDEEGLQAQALLPKKNGYLVQPDPQNTAIEGLLNWGAGQGSTRGSQSPLWSYADTLSWTQGKHAFKMGGEFRRDRSNGWNDVNLTPQLDFGELPAFPVTNLDANALPGLSANNQTLARQLLTDLAGSVGAVAQGYDLSSPSDLVFKGWADGTVLLYRDWRSNEWSAFFKDDWKIRPSVTLNVGAHWEWFGVAYDGRGLAGRPTGGSSGLCGISCGPLSSVEFVGKNSPQPDKGIAPDDWNNLAPSVGLSWSLPWFGKDKTVVRAGYGWSYTGRWIAGVPGGLNAIAGAIPGVFHGFGGNGVSYVPTVYENLSNYTMPTPKQFAPLRSSALNGTRSETLQAYADDRVSPYIQNFNFEIQREIMNNMSLQVSYVGTKGTKLFGGVNLNAVDIYASQGGESLLDAFNTTRTGGNSALFDRMLNGLTIPGTAGAVNGGTVRGSAALRAWTGTTGTRTNIANGNVGAFVQTLNNSTLVRGEGGGIIRNSGLFPENFIALNPQFNSVVLNGNTGNSTYHALQMQFTKRFSQGFTNQTSYTWSRAIGEQDGDGGLSPRDPKNRSLEKSLLGFHRTHSITSNGTFELPFGPNRAFLSGAPGWVHRLVERWQLGGIFSWTSGAPLSLRAPVSTIWQTSTNSTPMMVGDFPKSTGEVTMQAGDIPTYFPGFRQIDDPSKANVSTLNGLSSSFNLRAITDAQGQLLLVNPGPNQVGNMGQAWIEGPARLGLDMNVIKTVRLAEARQFVVRVDATNVLNTPIWGNPNVNINNDQFGRITTATGSRRFTMALRYEF